MTKTAPQTEYHGKYKYTLKGNVLVLTRARLRASRTPVFWRAIGPVAKALPGQDGLLAAFGFGEAPLGFQGTVSIWRSAADVTRFAYRQPEHAAVVASTPRRRGYGSLRPESATSLETYMVLGSRSVLE